jgi:hypothetical protein
MPDDGERGRRAALDLMAFVHFGVSALSRFVTENSDALNAYRVYLRRLLDAHFPLYRHSAFCTLGYNLRHGNRMLKPMLALLCYRANLLVPLLKAYRVLTRILGKDIKW